MTSIIGCFVVSADHPSLAGHFPNQPIVPGVVLLDHVLALLLPESAKPIALNVKFIRPVFPNETIQVTTQPAGRRIAFSAMRDIQPVLLGTVEVTG